jgi:hypothetical protein
MTNKKCTISIASNNSSHPSTLEVDTYSESTKVSGEARFLQVDSMQNKVYVPETRMMHKTLLPFKEKQVARYFSETGKDKHLKYFRNSIQKYSQYENDIENFPKLDYRTYRQAEKDERFFTTRTFINIFERDAKDRNRILKELLVKAYGEFPPFDIKSKFRQSWDYYLEGKIKLTLEYDAPAPKEYKEYLSNNLNMRQFVPYVLDLGKDDAGNFRKNLEGPSQIDAYIECVNTGLKIYVEAKYLSDISCNITYDVSRNQIARNIDVMLEDEKGKTLFLLLTPQYFKDNPGTRFYGYKMNDYLSSHLNLMADLYHRKNVEPADWKNIIKRIAWVSWEVLDELAI